MYFSCCSFDACIWKKDIFYINSVKWKKKLWHGNHNLFTTVKIFICVESNNKFGGSQILEEENDKLTQGLSEKVKALKSVFNTSITYFRKLLVVTFDSYIH